MFKGFFKKKKRKKISKKHQLYIVGVILVLSLFVGIYLIVRTKPNDNISISEDSITMFGNENPSFSVDFGKKDQPDKQWIRFEAKAKYSNPFEENKSEFFAKVLDFIVPKDKYGIEMSLKGVTLGDVEELNLEGNEEKVKSVSETLTINDVSTSSELIESGRVIGEVSEEPIAKKTVVNRDVADGVDLEYQILEGLGLKEEIVIKSLEEYAKECGDDLKNCKLPLNEFIFELKLDEGVELRRGLFTIRGKSTEVYYFTDSKGNYVSHFLPNWAQDANGERTYDVELKIENKEGGNYEAKVIVDINWLFSPTRVFPVRIDPSIVHDTKTEFDGGYFYDTESLDGPKVGIKNTVSYSIGSSTIAYWKLSEESGTGAYLLDSSGNSRHCTPTGTMFTSGRASGGRYFDGTDDILSCGTGISLANSSFTIEAWAKRNGPGSNDMIMGQGSAAANLGLHFGFESTNVFTCGFYGNDLDTSVTYTDSEWHHWACTYDASTNDRRIYRDGELVANNTATADYQGTGTFYIGRTYTTAYFIGEIDEVRISNVVLTADEVYKNGYLKGLDLYSGKYMSSSIDLGGKNLINALSWTDYGNNTGDGEIPYSTTGLVGHWKFNEVSGSAIANSGSCGSSCDGTLTADLTGPDAAINSGWTRNNRRWGAGAIMLDGTDDRVTVAHDASLNVSPTGSSYAYWVFCEGGDTGHPINKYANGTYNGYSMYISNTCVPSVSIYGLNSTNYTSPGAPPDYVGDLLLGKWGYVVHTLDASGVTRTYVNGLLVQTAAWTNGSPTNTTTTASLYFGYRNTSTPTYLRTIIDDVSIYSRTLSAGEIMANYQFGNIGFRYRTSDNGTTWGDLAGGSTKDMESFESSRLYDTDDYGLIDYWPMDETSGTSVDDVTGSNDATATSTSIVDGKFAKARSFSSTSSSIPINSVNPFTSNFTVETWVKFDTVNGAVQNSILGHGTASTDQGLSIGESSGKAYFGFYNDDLAGSQTLSANTWYHLVFVYDGTKKIYVNGLLDNTGTSSAYTSSSSNAEIGGYPHSSSHYMSGSIDEVRIYNIALDKASIQNNYIKGAPKLGKITLNTDSNITTEDTERSIRINSGEAGVDASTVAYWKLDETGGSSAYLNDYSLNANHATPTGTTYAAGKIGGSRSFDGSDDYISAPSGFADFTSGFTVEFWAKPTASSNNASFVDFANASNTDYIRVYRSGTTDTIAVDTAGAGVAPVTVASAITNNEWHHYAVTISGTGSSLVIYKDGVSIGTGSADAISNTTRLYNYIGKSNNSGSLYQGYIDDVRISNRVRTPDEIAETYNAGRETFVNKVFDNAYNLDNKSNLSYWVASDTLGSNLESILGSSAYANYQPDANTIAYWRLEEESGTGAYLKDSAGSNHGTPSAATLTQGKMGYGRDFPGASCNIDTGTGINLANASFSVEAWAKREAVGVLHLIIGQGTNTTNLGLYMGFRATNVFTCAFYGNTLDTTAVYTDLEWHHWTCTYNAVSNDRRIYRDGVLVAQGTASADYQGSGTFYIGRGPVGYIYNFNGIIDEVRVSDIPRSPQEIRETYEVGRRTHPIIINFKADLQSSNLITGSSDTSFSIDETVYEETNYIVNLEVGETIIVKENYGGTEYIAQGTVATLNNDTGAVTVSSWDSGSTFPSSGFTVSASVFKWQEEIVDIRGLLPEQRSSISTLSFRLKEGVGANFWVDKISSSKYLTGGDIQDDEVSVLAFNDDVSNRDAVIRMEGLRSLSLSSSEVYKSNTITSADLSSYNKIPLWVASDELGNSTSLLLGGTSDYSNYIPETNTVGYWKLDEDSGSTANDSSSSNNDLTISGAFSIEGKIDDGRKFDGRDDYLYVNSNPTTNNANWSMEAWMKPASLDQTGIVVFNGRTSGGYGFGIGEVSTGIVGTGNKLFVYIVNGTGDNFIDCGYAFSSINKWYHVAITRDSTTTKCYVDGIQTPITTTTAPVIVTARFSVGALLTAIDTPSTLFAGSIDEVRVSDTARSATDIWDSYNIDKRSIQPEIEFRADLESSNLISSSSDYSFDISEVDYGTSSAIENLSAGDYIIVTESTYKAQGIVNSVNGSTGAVVVGSWVEGSTFPTGGFTTSAKVFKWEREYLYISDMDSSYLTSLTKFTVIKSDTSSVWYDDIRVGDEFAYLDPTTYFQYKTIFSKWDNGENLDLYITQVGLDYTAEAEPTMDLIMRHGKWFNESGKQPFWWAQ